VLPLLRTQGGQSSLLYPEAAHSKPGDTASGLTYISRVHYRQREQAQSGDTRDAGPAQPSQHLLMTETLWE